MPPSHRTTTSRKKDRRNRGNRPGAKSRPTPSKPNLNIDDVLVAAQGEMERMNIEQAEKLYSSAASLLRSGQSPTHGIRERHLLHVLEKLSEIKVGQGDQEGALKYLMEALSVLEAEYPGDVAKDMFYYETRSTFTMYLGQLCSEDQALEAYQKGIQSLETCIRLVEAQTENDDIQDEEMHDSNDDDGEDHENGKTTKHPLTKQEILRELRQKLSGAYCTVAELYLTDLCFAEQAEEHCESYMQKALAIQQDGNPMPDALQTMASLRLSQDESKRKEAIGYMLDAFQCMQKGCDALASLVGLTPSPSGAVETAKSVGLPPNDTDTQALELKEVEAANALPEFEFRCQSSKLLLECAALPDCPERQKQACVASAISVLGSLLAQNDEVIEIWYLTGCAFCAQAGSDNSSKDSARHYVKRAMEMLVDTQKAVKQQQQYAEDEEEDELEEQLEELICQIEDVQAKLDELGDDDEAETMED